MNTVKRNINNIKNIAIKNDNVGKKPLTLSFNIYNFIKRKPLEKI